MRTEIGKISCSHKLRAPPCASHRSYFAINIFLDELLQSWKFLRRHLSHIAIVTVNRSTRRLPNHCTYNISQERLQ